MSEHKSIFIGPKRVFFPKEWKERKLSSLVTRLKNGLSESQKFEGKGIPVSRIETISDGEINYNKIGYIDNLENSYAEYKLQFGDILLSHINSKPHIGKNAIYRNESVLYHGMNLLLIRFNREEIDPFFGYYFLNSKLAKAYYLSMCKQAVNQASLNQKEIGNLRILTPPVQEQHNIVFILSTVDQAIERTQEVIDQTARLKKGLMQELLTKGIGHTEFKEVQIGQKKVEVAEEWTLETFNQITSKIQYGLSQKMELEGQYPIFRMNNIENGYMVDRPLKFVNLNDNDFKKFGLNKGDILFNRTNSIDLVGKTGIFLLDGDYVFASYLIRLVSNDLVFPSYLNYYMNSFIAQSYFFSVATRGASQANINARNLSKTRLPLPPKEEQEEILSVLKCIDGKINAEEKYLDQLKEMKNGLMQDLLTGKVRVKKLSNGGE